MRFQLVLVEKILYEIFERHFEWMKIFLMKIYRLHHRQINFSLSFYCFKLSYIKFISFIFLCLWFLDTCHRRFPFRCRGMQCVSIEFDVLLRVRLSAVSCQQPLQNTKIIQCLRCSPQPLPKPLFFWSFLICRQRLRWGFQATLRFET